VEESRRHTADCEVKHSVCSSNVIPLRHYFGELFQIDEMMLEKGFQNVEVEPIIIVNCYVAKPDHGLEAPAKGGLNDLRGFQGTKFSFKLSGKPSLSSATMWTARSIAACTAR
jgi:hypothetical protein